MDYSIEELQEKANLIRQDVVKMLVTAGSGHSAGPLGLADVFTALYFAVLKVNPQEPFWPERDRFVLSCGHVCPVFYATLAHAGFFPKNELLTLRKLSSRLQGHPHNFGLPGVETSSGSLGQGISQAIGMAIAGKMDRARWRVITLMSDGEQQEGQVWEALMFAANRNFNNLIVLIDRNQIQIDGHTEQVMPLEPLKQKYEAFNWQVLEIDGHNIPEIIEAFSQAKATAENPTVIIAHTIPGKDVEFMENLPECQGKTPTIGESIEALRELRSLYGQIDSDV